MAHFSDTHDTGFDEAKARGWYGKWRRVIRDWVKKNADLDIADIVLLLPDLLMLAVGTTKDPRIPSSVKLSLMSAVVYVLSPFDLVPEAIMGVAGLIDDAGILILALNAAMGAAEIDPSIWEEIWRAHWHGDDNPVNVVRKLYEFITENAKRLFGKVWEFIRRNWNSSHNHGSHPHTGPISIT